MYCQLGTVQIFLAAKLYMALQSVNSRAHLILFYGRFITRYTKQCFKAERLCIWQDVFDVLFDLCCPRVEHIIGVKYTLH